MCRDRVRIVRVYCAAKRRADTEVCPYGIGRGRSVARVATAFGLCGKGEPPCLPLPSAMRRSPYFGAALMMPVKSSALRAAPPIRPPSMLGWASSSGALLGFMLPPYWMRTDSAATAP